MTTVAARQLADSQEWADDVVEVVEKERCNVPKWQFFRAFTKILPQTPVRDDYPSIEDVTHPWNTWLQQEEESDYLKIFETFSTNDHDLEAKLKKLPERSAPHVLWLLEHLSQPARYSELYIVDKELYFLEPSDILLPFFQYGLHSGTKIGVICGPKILNGAKNALFTLFEHETKGSLQVFYFTSQAPRNTLPNLRYMLADFDIYYEKPHPNDRLGNPIESGSVKRDFLLQDSMVGDYREIVKKKVNDRLFLTRSTYKAFLKDIVAFDDPPSKR